jgi:hypothetical protein
MSSFDQSSLIITVPVAGALTAANGALFYSLPCNADLVAIYANVGTAPTGTTLLALRVNKNTVSIQTLSFVASSKTASATIAYPLSAGLAGIDDSQPNLTAPGTNSGFNYIGAETPAPAVLGSFSAGDVVSVDVTAVGSTVAGSNLVVSLYFVRH